MLDLRVRPEVECLIYSGDHFQLTLVVRDAAGKPIDLTGAEVETQLHAWDGTTYQGAPLITCGTGSGGLTITNPEAGEMVVEFSDTQTEALASAKYYVVTRVTSALGKHGTVQPFLAQVLQTPL